MALVTNICKKHGNAFPETECPYCKLENFEAQIEGSKKFFKAHGHRDIFELIGQFDITFEELFQHFRIRILEEITPVLQRVRKDMEL